jgi:hypothetical protein
LTDYVLSAVLQNAFAEREAAAAASQSVAPLSSEVKDLVDQEVQNDLAEESAEARNPQQTSDELPPEFRDRRQHTLVSGDAIEAEIPSTSQPCTIQQGDAIQFDGSFSPDSSDSNAQVRVLASRGNGCAVGSRVEIAMSDLIEADNQMRETVERGLGALQSGQGQKNLPRLPAAATAPPVMTLFAASLKPDTSGANEIRLAAQEGTKMEQDVAADYSSAPAGEAEPYPAPAPAPILAAPSPSPSPAPSPAPPIRVTRNPVVTRLGQTETEVIDSLGRPTRISFMGGLQKQYDYPDRKVIFNDGVVSAVRQEDAAPPQTTTGVTPPPPAPRPAALGSSVVQIGQSEDQVRAALGEPSRVSFLGGLKKRYDYPNLQVIFTDGSVSSVQPIR